MHRTVRALAWLMAAAAVASIAVSAPATAKPRSAQPVTEVTVAATDLAGNRSEVRQRFTVGGAPPLLEILDPWDGSKAEEAAVTVRVAVTAFSPIASVEIGTGPAEEEGGGIWRAQVGLALGENVVTVRATDADGLTGSDSVKLRYDWLGRESRWEYGVDDIESVVRDGLGAITKRSFGAHSIDLAVDSQGNPLSEKSAAESIGGIDATTTYDLAGRVVRQEDKVTGLVDEYEYEDLKGRRTRWTRTVQVDGSPEVLVETRAYENSPTGETRVTVTETSSGSTRVTRVGLDPMGRMLWREEETPAGLAREDFEYTERGQVKWHRDAMGRVSTFAYDASGRLVRSTDAAGVETVIVSDAAGHELSRVRGVTPRELWSMTYDELGRMSTRTLSDSSAEVASWSWSYPGSGRVVETDPRGRTVTRTLDGRGRPKREELSKPQFIRELEYDGPWKKRESATEGDWSAETSRSYDDRGRVLSEVESWSASGLSYRYETTTSWSGRTATITSREIGAPADRVETVLVDSLGNQLSRVAGGLTDKWSYNAAGLLIWSQPAGKPRTDNSYDGGWLIEKTRGTETWAFDYYLDGREKTVVDPSGRTLTRTWDPRGLLLSETHGQGTSVASTAWEYDHLGGLKARIEAPGTSDEARWAMTSGVRGELTQVSLPGGLGAFDYEYWPDGKLKKVNRPAGASEEFDYDGLGRITLRKRGDRSWITAWSEGEGETISPVGDKASFLLDGRGRVARKSFLAGGASLPGLSQVEQRFDARDQLLEAVEQSGAGSVTTRFEYDARWRLQQTTRGAETVTWGYGSSDEIASVTSPAGATSYAYGSDGRLSTVTGALGSLSFEWEPQSSFRPCPNILGRTRASRA